MWWTIIFGVVGVAFIATMLANSGWFFTQFLSLLKPVFDIFPSLSNDTLAYVYKACNWVNWLFGFNVVAFTIDVFIYGLTLVIAYGFVRFLVTVLSKIKGG